MCLRPSAWNPVLDICTWDLALGTLQIARWPLQGPGYMAWVLRGFLPIPPPTGTSPDYWYLLTNFELREIQGCGMGNFIPGGSPSRCCAPSIINLIWEWGHSRAGSRAFVDGGWPLHYLSSTHPAARWYLSWLLVSFLTNFEFREIQRREMGVPSPGFSRCCAPSITNLIWEWGRSRACSRAFVEGQWPFHYQEIFMTHLFYHYFLDGGGTLRIFC